MTSLVSSRKMVTCANLLDSEIYEIQEVWTRQRDLWYANRCVEEFTKGSVNFCAPDVPFGIAKGHGPKRDS